MKMAQRTWFLLPALAALALALLPPVRTLANGFLFSAHMLQHLLLQLVVPPLLLLILPLSGPAEAPKINARYAVGAWLAGVGAMWIWHDPALCNAVLHSPSLRLLQYGSLLLMGTLFWWPVAGPRRDWRLPPLLGILYLFSACLGCTILGIVITFAPPELYSKYFHAAGVSLPLFDDWELTPAADQHLGGLLMWVPACLIYICGILALMARWYSAPEVEGVNLAQTQT